MRHGDVRLDGSSVEKTTLPAQGDMMHGFGEKLKTPAMGR
jgi:hypothetical protein